MQVSGLGVRLDRLDPGELAPKPGCNCFGELCVFSLPPPPLKQGAAACPNQRQAVFENGGQRTHGPRQRQVMVLSIGGSGKVFRARIDNFGVCQLKVGDDVVDELTFAGAGLKQGKVGFRPGDSQGQPRKAGAAADVDYVACGRQLREAEQIQAVIKMHV